MTTPIEMEARMRIEERVRRASQPHVPAPRRRHRIASQLRKLAAQLDN